MRRPPSIFLIIVAAIAGFLLLGAIFGGGGGWHHDNDRITIVNPDTGSGNGSSGVAVNGQQVAPGSVVVIDNGRRGFGFFPFFPIFPLLFFGFLIFLFTRARRFRGGWGGPGRWEPRPDGRGPSDPSRFSNSTDWTWVGGEERNPASHPSASSTSTSTTKPNDPDAMDPSATAAPRDSDASSAS